MKLPRILPAELVEVVVCVSDADPDVALLDTILGSLRRGEEH